MNFLTKFGLLLIMTVFAANLSAKTITIDANDWGWYRQDGSHSPGNANTWTGTDGSNTFRNSFYNFDVSGIETGSTIVSASINFLANNGTFVTNDSYETIEIWDVNTTPGLGSSMSVYQDLMSGTKYGETDVYKGESSVMPGFSVDLDSLSFADILSDGFFSLGAHISSLNEGYNQVTWWGSGSVSPAASLSIEYSESSSIPEPAILSLLGLGLLGIGWYKKS